MPLPPSDLSVAQFIAAIVNGDVATVAAKRAAEPTLPQANIRTLAVLGDI